MVPNFLIISNLRYGYELLLLLSSKGALLEGKEAFACVKSATDRGMKG